MLVNDECSSWYSRVADFLKYQFRIGEKKSYMVTDQHAWPNRTIPLQSAWSIALNAMLVECES